MALPRNVRLAAIAPGILRRMVRSSATRREAQAAIDGCEWFSFDVFDTVVTRAVPRPSDVFLIMGETLGPRYGMSADRFAAARRSAEAALRQSLARGADLTLQAIYDEVVRQTPIPQADVLHLMNLETETELEFARPWEPGVALLDAWRGRARFVGFLSDMYLPADSVRRILERVGSWKPGDRVYTSGDEQATKASGTLFALVGERHGVDPRAWVHFGDNPVSDVAVPRGLSMLAVQTTQPVAAERTTAAFLERSPSFGTRSLGIAAALQRAAGAAAESLTPHQRQVWEVGAHVVAPLVLWYAHAVLEAAARDGRRNLWFLSRDGEIVWKAARVANETVGFAGGLHYVLASRQGLHLPSFTGFDAEANRWLFVNPTIATPRDVAQRAGFGQSQAAAWLDAVQDVCAPDEPIDGRQAALWELLQQEPHRSNLAAAAAEQRASARSYLGSISDFERLGIVDIGWNANLQCSFRRILGRDDMHGYYLGLFSRNPEVPEAAVFPQLFSHAEGTAGPYAAGLSLFEALFAGTHPGLIRYGTDSDGSACGVLAEPVSWSAQIDWGVKLMHEAAMLGVETMVRERVIPTKDEVAGIVADLVANPTIDEAATLGTWPTQNLQNRTIAEPLVPRLSSWRVVTQTFRTGSPPPLYWEAGGRILNGRFQHGILRVARRISREVKHWRP
jgi:FMN phosphatase YigB (HAD superfamily)